MMLYHRPHPPEASLDYIPSLHQHPQVVGFVPVTHSTREQEIAEAVAKERERCAKIAESHWPVLTREGDSVRKRIAAAIRNAK